MGAIILLDLLLRARTLWWFYTDSGVLPRASLKTLYPGYQYLSIHALSGSLWWQAILFCVAGIVAFALLVGYRTRLAAVVSFLLLLSLQARNPLVLNAGDIELRRLLFWGLFLPLGGRWSIDRTRSASSVRVVSVATVALLLQVVILYTVNAAIKLRATPWIRGTAVRYVFSLEQFLVLFGDTLAHFPRLLTLVDWGWLALLSASILLVVLTGRARAVFVGLFATVHLSLLFTMSLGIFPLVSLAGLLPFVPSVVWDRLETRTKALADRLPEWHRPAEPRLPVWLRTTSARFGRLTVIVLLVGMVAFNGISATGVGVAGVDARTIEHHQHWSMFAPWPLLTDGWLEAPATLQNGSRIDAFHHEPVSWAKPTDVSREYPTARWRKYITRLRAGDADTRAFADALCTRWAQTHEQSLTQVSIVYLAQPTRLDGPEPIRRRHLLTVDCTSVG